MIGICKDCKFRVDGECRRYPPQVSIVMMPTKVAVAGPTLQPSPLATFPPVEDDLWCGEFTVRMSISL
jgi:hypothetical protein